MKRKYLKSMVAAALAASMTLSLCACGKTVRDGDGESKISKETKEEKTEYTLSECFSKEGTNIWYYIDDEYSLGKDARITAVYVFEDGSLIKHSVSGYDGYGYKLGDIAQMSDEEIIAELENVNQTKQQERLQKLEKDIAVAEAALAQGFLDQPFTQQDGVRTVWADVTKYKSEFEKYLADLKQYDCTQLWKYADLNLRGVLGPVKGDYELAIYTDSTGNHTDYEKLKFNYYHALYPNSVISFYRAGDSRLFDSNDDSIHMSTADLTHICEYKFEPIDSCYVNDYYTLTENITYKSAEVEYETAELRFTGALIRNVAGVEVYDSNYGGYNCSGGFFITRIENPTTFKLDDVGAEGIEVDPED